MASVLRVLRVRCMAGALSVRYRVHLTVIIGRAGPELYARAGSITVTVRDRIRCKGPLLAIMAVIMAVRPITHALAGVLTA